MIKLLLLLLAGFTPLTEEQTKEVLGQLETAQAANESVRTELNAASASITELRAANATGQTLLISAGVSVGEAKTETKGVQVKLDDANATIAKQAVEITTLKKQWWHLFFTVVGEGLVIVGLIVWICK